MRVPIVLACLLVAGPARADKTVLVGLAPASDARKAVAIGPAGQTYEPDGKGAWVRHHAGGVSEELTVATAAGGTVIAGAKGAPPFKRVAGAWTAVYLQPHAQAIVGTGSRPTAAVGRNVYALDKDQPVKLGEAPGAVAQLAGSAAGVIAQTDRGLVRLEGSAWKPVKGAPRRVIALVSDRWALVDRGAFDLKTLKAVTWPAGLAVRDATVLPGKADDTLVAVGVKSGKLELVTVKAGKVDVQDIPVDKPGPVVGVAADREGRVVVALRDGRIAVRDKATWTTTAVRDELDDAHPGSPPASSR